MSIAGQNIEGIYIKVFSIFDSMTILNSVLEDSIFFSLHESDAFDLFVD